MRHARFAVIILLASSAAAIVSNGQKQIPPGVREADKQTSAPLEPPPTPSAKKADPRALQQEAEQLAQLSAGIPEQIQHYNEGQLPKDLADQLKRIEKLAKHLRGEVAP